MMTRCAWCLLIAMFALIYFVCIQQRTAGAAERRAGAKAGDCAACHKGQKMLPSDHSDTKMMTYKDCLTCHEKKGHWKLGGKLPGSHMHSLNGVTCAKCHGKTKKPSEVEMGQCLACHDAEKMALKTSDVKPTNPHTSPHYGTSLDCNLCHHQHRKSENYCAQCHKFDFTVP